MNGRISMGGTSPSTRPSPVAVEVTVVTVDSAPLRSQDPAMARPLIKKDDDQDDEDYSPFLGIEKGAVLQEARVFYDPQLDARRCSQVITKLLYLLNQGETFTKITRRF